MATQPNRGVLDTLRALDGDVLVIGAGGKMGFHLAGMLRRGFDELGKRNRVLAVSRFGSQGSTQLFREYNIPTISCDLTVDRELENLPDAPQIYFLAGFKFGSADNPQLLKQMNVDLPARVARRYASSRITALSTGCVYSFVAPETGGSTETDPTAPVGAYAQSCLGREKSFTDSGAKCALIRLNYSVDLRYGVLVDVAQKILRGEPVDVTMGYANVIWQRDATAAIIQSIAYAATPPFVLNLTGPQILSIRQVAERFGKLLDKPVVITGQEAATAWLNNAAKARQLFGPPSIDEDTLMQWVAQWLVAGGETLGKPTHFEVRDGNF